MCVSTQYFRMELMHAEKLRKQQKELEQAKIDVVGLSFSGPKTMSAVQVIVH